MDELYGFCHSHPDAHGCSDAIVAVLKQTFAATNFVCGIWHSCLCYYSPTTKKAVVSAKSVVKNQHLCHTGTEITKFFFSSSLDLVRKQGRKKENNFAKKLIALCAFTAYTSKYKF